MFSFTCNRFLNAGAAVNYKRYTYYSVQCFYIHIAKISVWYECLLCSFSHRHAHAVFVTGLTVDQLDPYLPPPVWSSWPTHESWGWIKIDSTDCKPPPDRSHHIIICQRWTLNICANFDKKAVLSQRWPRNAPHIWVPWKFPGLPDYDHGYFSQIFSWAFVLMFVVLFLGW